MSNQSPYRWLNFEEYQKIKAMGNNVYPDWMFQQVTPDPTSRKTGMIQVLVKLYNGYQITDQELRNITVMILSPDLENLEVADSLMRSLRKTRKKIPFRLTKAKIRRLTERLIYRMKYEKP